MPTVVPCARITFGPRGRRCAWLAAPAAALLAALTVSGAAAH